MKNLGVVIDMKLEKADFFDVENQPRIKIDVEGVKEPITLKVPNPFEEKKTLSNIVDAMSEEYRRSREEHDKEIKSTGRTFTLKMHDDDWAVEKDILTGGRFTFDFGAKLEKALLKLKDRQTLELIYYGGRVTVTKRGDSYNGNKWHSLFERNVLLNFEREISLDKPLKYQKESQEIDDFLEN